MKQIKEPILITCSDGLIYSLWQRIRYKKNGIRTHYFAQEGNQIYIKYLARKYTYIFPMFSFDANCQIRQGGCLHDELEKLRKEGYDVVG